MSINLHETAEYCVRHRMLVRYCAECLEELRAENERLRAKLQEAREALQELRISLHSQWRRPEECWEMSLIDDVLSITRTER